MTGRKQKPSAKGSSEPAEIKREIRENKDSLASQNGVRETG